MSSPAQSRLSQVASHLAGEGTTPVLSPVPTVAGDSVGPRLVGKVAIITGCNSPIGIGRATALQFAHNGVKALFICDVVSTHLESLKHEISRLSPDVPVHVRTFDAADEAAVEAVVREAVEKYGRLDVFFANAGIVGGAKMVWDTSAEEFMNTMRVNALSAFLVVKHASAAMKVTGPEKPASGGSIVATSSVAGIRSGGGTTDYSASKAAVINVMQTSAFQLAGTNIRCNALCPGLTQTGMTSAIWEGAKKRGTEKKIGQVNPLKRAAVSDEIARVALFLASDESSYVNAQFWAVDGGMSGSHPTAPGKFF